MLNPSVAFISLFFIHILHLLFQSVNHCIVILYSLDNLNIFLVNTEPHYFIYILYIGNYLTVFAIAMKSYYLIEIKNKHYYTIK